jgi:hypothetical protein
MADPVDELFVGPLDEFVKRRDALVKELKTAGDKDTAAAVKALRKPSTAAWAVNQVARRRGAELDEQVGAANGVPAAQARAGQGKDGSGLRTAGEQWRKRIHALAAEVAKEAGAQYRDDAAETFEAASTSDEWAAVLKAGRLVATLSPSGFGLQDMPDPVLTRPAREAPAARPEPEPAPAPVEDAVEEEPVDEKAIAEASARLEKATHRLRRAEQRLEQAEAAVAEAAQARDEAAAALRELEG